MNVRKTLPVVLIPAAVLFLLTIEFSLEREVLAGRSSLEAALGNRFTYQGYLTDGGNPANGIYHFSFELWDAEIGGDSLGLIEVEDVQVDSGVFTAILDFGPGVFYGEDRWLQIGVKPDGGTGGYVPIEGRQMLRPVPYALFAVQVGRVEWNDLTSRPAGLNNGDQDTTYSAGYGLELAGTTFNVMPDTIQTRVESDCAVGSTVRVINADGSVVCEPHDTRPVFKQTALDTDDIVGAFTDITVGVDGLPVISYLDATNATLKVARCNDTACTHASSYTVDGDFLGQYTSITIGVDGLPVISYYDWLNQDLKVAHCDDAACTSATATSVDSTPDMVGRYSSVTIGTDGLPIISYWDETNNDLKVAHCDDVACTTAASDAIDYDDDVGKFTAITIGVDGMPIISYFDETNSYLKVAHCKDIDCPSANTNPVDVEYAGYGTSITIGRDSLPVISYLDTSLQRLRVARCTDVTCTNASIHVVDVLDSLGEFTSIAIGADGMPVISYYDDVNGDLKVAHCDDPACYSARTNIVDSNLDVGNFSAIHIGTDSMPIISYCHLSNGDLMVTHCSNVFCIPYWRRR